MDVRKTLKEIDWWSPWRAAGEGAGAEARALVAACAASAAPEPPPGPTCLQDLVARSEAFPLPFPIETVRAASLQARRLAARLAANALSTRPLLHERVLWLLADFILYKRKYGSSVEQELYKDMTIPALVDRLLRRRAATFMKARDQYRLLSGETGCDGWESVGTESERAPLVLRAVLSYDEMKVSALLSVSGCSECLNDGARRNAGQLHDDDIEKNALIIGIVGARFKRPLRMEYEDVLVTAAQNTAARGYGPARTDPAPGRADPAPDRADPAPSDSARAYRQMWDNFYQIPSTTYAALSASVQLSACSGARVFSSRWAGVRGAAFDSLAYARRTALTADTVLLEASARAAERGTTAFVNVVGAGLGIWKHSAHQVDVYVLAFLERAAALLARGLLRHVADINFAYVQPRKPVLDLFENNGDKDNIPKLFLKNSDHPRGGISVWLESREPSARLRAAHAGQLLVLTYAGDGNALPGNEFWLGQLWSSGDSAAACATQVAELHNAHINAAVAGARACVAGERMGVRTLQDHCADT